MAQNVWPPPRRSLRCNTLAPLALLLAGACSRASRDEPSSVETTNETATPVTANASYPLDELGRAASRGRCPEVSLEEFGGEQPRFLPPARVAPAFRARLAELEQIAREVGVRIYGRAPSAILILASYDCRAVTGNARRWSEHALGNAVDISGFRFAPARSWWAWFPEGFDVRIERHWQARGARESRHALFLDELTRRLIERDVFRTLLGPAHPKHRDHFHFDMAPGRYVHL